MNKPFRFAGEYSLRKTNTPLERTRYTTKNGRFSLQLMGSRYGAFGTWWRVSDVDTEVKAFDADNLAEAKASLSEMIQELQ